MRLKNLALQLVVLSIVSLELTFGQNECGFVYSAPNARILGGKTAIPHSWPSIAYIDYLYLRNETVNGTISPKIYSGSFTGTLINTKTIITAAHALYIYDSNNKTIPITSNEFHRNLSSIFTVYLGLQKISDVSTAQAFSVLNLIIHPNYTDTEYNYQNDIALIVLDHPATLDRNVQIACLPSTNSTNFPLNGYTGVIAGWGITVKNDTTNSDELKNVRINLYSTSSCIGYGYNSTIVNDWNSSFCAGDIGKDFCAEDDGSPLYVLNYDENGQGKYVIAGIASFGVDLSTKDFDYGCSSKAFPASIYTRVSYYTDWIKAQLNSLTTTTTSTTTTTTTSTSTTTTTTLPPSKCGVSFNAINTKITGGKPAIAHSWPSISFITYNWSAIINGASQNFDGFLTGTLINTQTILTSASSLNAYLNGTSYPIVTNQFHPNISSIFKVNLGIYNLSDFSNAQYNTIRQIIIHPNYNNSTYTNDIALLFLTNPVQVNKYVQTACLPSTNSNSFPLDGYTGVIAGWGETVQNGNESAILNNARINIYSRNDCVNFGYSGIDWNTQFCAGDTGKDFCSDDDGIPLYVQQSTNDGLSSYVVAGIASLSIFNCNDTASVYTRVSNYVDWINYQLSPTTTTTTTTTTPIPTTTTTTPIPTTTTTTTTSTTTLSTTTTFNSQCVNINDYVCDYVLAKIPTYCTLDGATVQNIPFKVYCARSCNNCFTTLASTTAPNCVDLNPFACSLFPVSYCLTQSFIGLIPFRNYCAKLCNVCKSTTSLPSTLTSTTTKTLCEDKNPLICSSRPVSQCLEVSYIGLTPYRDFCAKTCNACSNKPTTTVISTILPKLCIDQDTKICSSNPILICSTASYIGKIPYRDYCAKTCNTCNAKKPDSTTSTTSTSTIAVRAPTAQCFDSSDACIFWKDSCNLLASRNPNPCRFTCKIC